MLEQVSYGAPRGCRQDQLKDCISGTQIHQYNFTPRNDILREQTWEKFHNQSEDEKSLLVE